MPTSDNGIEYDYTEKEDKIPTVQDGIVIEDEEGNQFVWIPVGKIKNKENEETTIITLGRYTFDEKGKMTGPKNGSDVIEEHCVEENAEEHEKSKYGNSIAKDIEGFKKSVERKHGYYIARYESGNNNEKPTSKQGTVWNNVNQPSASNAARKMYENKTFQSDLINSFAWDTAIVFLQKYSGDADYSRQNSKNTNVLLTTGERSGTTDKVCNIYDMASNCWEWTTETYQSTSEPCVGHGGNYVVNTYYASSRIKNRTAIHVGDNISFRVILYL